MGTYNFFKVGVWIKWWPFFFFAFGVGVWVGVATLAVACFGGAAVSGSGVIFGNGVRVTTERK